MKAYHFTVTVLYSLLSPLSLLPGEVKFRADRDAKQISMVQQHVFHQAMKVAMRLCRHNGDLSASR